MSRVLGKLRAVAEPTLPDKVAKLAVIDSATLQERAYVELRNAIRGGRFAPGELLTLKGISEALGTSAMPVREAMRRLAAEQALEILPNRLIRVPHISRARFDELTDIRQLLEGRAAALAAARATPAELAEIRLANERLAATIETGIVPDMLALNEAFHYGVYRAAKAPALLAIIETLWLQSGPYLCRLVHAAADPPYPMRELGLAHHVAAIAALSIGDGAAAGRAMVEDIEVAANWYRSAIGFEQ